MWATRKISAYRMDSSTSLSQSGRFRTSLSLGPSACAYYAVVGHLDRLDGRAAVAYAEAALEPSLPNYQDLHRVSIGG